jgi:hypothetical protein
LSLPGTRVWLRQPEHKLNDPGNPVTKASKDLEGQRLLVSRLRGNDKKVPGTRPGMTISLSCEL